VIELSLLTALLAGLLGGVHCVGMCGGIVAAFSFRADGSTPPFRLHLAYNLGRVSSYVLFGALVGALGASLKLADFMPVQMLLFVLAQVVMILLGLYLAGFNQWVLIFERAGGALWNRVKPLFQKLLAGEVAAAGGAGGHGLGLAAVRAGVFGAGVGASGRQRHLGRGADAGIRPRHAAEPAGNGPVRAQIQPFMQQRWVRRAAGLTVAGFGAWAC